MAWNLKTTDKRDVFGGSARIIISDVDLSPVPSKFSDVIIITTPSKTTSTYSLATGYVDVGATDGGVSVTRGFDKNEWTVDQILWPIDEWITQWKMKLTTSLAEASLENLEYAWDAEIDTSYTSTEDPEVKLLKIGANDTVTMRRLCFQVDKRRGKFGGTTDYTYMRLYVFRQAKYDGSDVAHEYKKGEKTLLPISFTLFADSTQTWQEFGIVLDQSYWTFTP